MRQQLRMLGVFILFFTSISVPLLARSEPVNMPHPGYIQCEKTTTPLPYTSYGITIPKKSDWLCSAFIDESSSSARVAYWKKDGKEILFFDAELDDNFSGLWNGLEKSEPDATIRVFAESFLGDEDVLETNKELKEFSEKGLENLVKGIVWNSSNEQIVVYLFEEDDQGVGTGIIGATAFFYKKNQNKRFLSVSCDTCTLQEFLSEVVLPSIQKH